MKKATCNDLRGACDTVITGATPEEMAENCKKHVMQLIQSGDMSHMPAIQEMKKLSPEEQQAWYEEFKNCFNELEDAE